MTKVLIIGFGKVGSNLHSVIKTLRYLFLFPPIKNSHSKLNRNSLVKSNIVFICTQDDKIKTAVKRIIGTGISLKGKIVVHTSGSLSSDELSALKKMGCKTASFHPVQTFNRKASLRKKNAGRKDNLFRNIYVAIEGNPYAVKVLKGIAADAGSIPVSINKDFKIFHHICCVVSSSFTVANLSLIEEIYTQINGFNKVNFFNIYKPLILKTLANIASTGIEQSLTGPIIRNDIKTVENHIRMLKSMKNNHDIIDYYKFMSSKVLRITAGKDKALSRKINKLKKLLNSK